MPDKKYVIIGSGIAGITAAEAIREKDKVGKIVILTRESGLPYSRPMLTKTPLKGFDGNLWTIKDEEWFKINNIELITEVEITSLSTENKVVKYQLLSDNNLSDEINREAHAGENNKVHCEITHDVNDNSKNIVTNEITAEEGKTPVGGSLSYDSLIIASGAEAFIPPFKGADKKSNLFTIRKKEDILRIKSSIKTDSSAVIIGGGVIGIEMALELLHYGVKVTIVEAAPYFMTRQIDEEMSNRIRADLYSIGIDIYTSASIYELISSSQEPSKIAAIKLGNGTEIACDIVIAATGIKANTAFIDEKCGIIVNRGIVIDQQGRTSVTDVFSCGDCAEYMGVNYALWTEAMAQGRVAGINAASESGTEEVIGNIDASLVINSPEICIFAIGDNGKNPNANYEIKVSDNSNTTGKFFVNEAKGKSFEKRYYLEGKLVGAMILGNLSRMSELKSELKGEINGQE